MDKLRNEMEQLKGKLQVYEHWAIKGKLIICATHELRSIADTIKRCLLLVQEEENDPEAESHITEALKYLQWMSLTIDSLIACAKSSATQNLT